MIAVLDSIFACACGIYGGVLLSQRDYKHGLVLFTLGIILSKYI
jgi:hypothetical protein